MLRRAAIRSTLRPWSSTSARPPILSPYRAYSKNKPPKPPNPTRPPPQSPSHTFRTAKHGPGALKGSPAATGGASAGGFPSDATQNSSQQKKPPEAGQASREPSSEGHGSETSSELPYSGSQTEFDTSASPKGNTVPEDSSEPQTEPSSIPPEGKQIPLPDLTKGIPSTIDAELEQASRQKGNAEEEKAEEGPRPSSSGGRGDRGMPASAYVTSAERRRNRMMMWTFASMLLLVMTGPIYLGRNWENEEEEKAHPDAPSGWGFMLFYNRVRARLFTTLEYYSEPAFPKLLPDPDPRFAQPYTLVVSLEDLLVHSEWTREHGWRLAKRPGVDYFLRYLNQYYEIVIFTSVPSAVGAPVLMKLDPFGIVMWRLFREATRYKNGEYIKDLSYLNRDLSKIILLDTDASHGQAQPENAIIVPKWDGTSTDTGLVDLIPFFEYLAAMGTDDTRPVLKSFEGTHIPTEFAAREAAARKRFNEQLALERQKRPRRSAGGFLGSLLGISPGAAGGAGGMVMMEPGPDGEPRPVPVPRPGEGFEQGKMLHDQIRERGQRQYEIVEREIRENAEKWMREIAAEEEKFKRESVKGLTSGFKGWFGMGKEEEEGEKREEKGGEAEKA